MAAQSQTCRSRLLRVYRIIVKSSMESRQSRRCCQGFDSTQSELSFLFFRVEIYVPDLLHNPEWFLKLYVDCWGGVGETSIGNYFGNCRFIGIVEAQLRPFQDDKNHSDDTSDAATDDGKGYAE